MGLAIAQGLAREGARVVIAAKDPVRGATAARQIEGARFIQTDVGQAEQARNLAQKTLEAFGRIDVLVNNAGIHAGAPFTDETEVLW
jgi:ketoreductase RED2